jgi:pimeloyl-ACP methyl ester carboxylesterase
MNTWARPGGRRVPLAIASSLVAGLVGAIALVIGPAAGALEHTITGSVLLAFGLGWALLALLTTMFTDQPQRWAAVPAAYMLLTGFGLIVVAPSAGAMDALAWVWPPVLLALVIWMVVQARRTLGGRSRWLLYPVFGFLALMALGGGFERIGEALDDDAQPSTGRLLDVGGHSLYIACQGEGLPTVVLESGLGEGSIYWARIAPVVATTTTMCAYDRAGYGRSERVPAAQDGDAVAADLHALLAASGNPGPYVLVGHSTGGPYVRAFAAHYPGEVAGMVLLDAQPANAFTSLPDFPGFYARIGTVSALVTPLARLGLLRLAYALIPVDLPPAAAAAERAEQSSPRNAAGQRNEFSVLRATLDEALALTTLGDRPLVVVTAASGAQAGWLAAQEETARLSTNGWHRVIDDQTHTTLITSERGAAASASAILDVVRSVRTGAPLTAQQAEG